MKNLVIVVLALSAFACDKEEIVESIPTPPQVQEPELYFPPTNTDDWEEISTSELDWNPQDIADLLSYLETNNTRAFIILKDGKIVIEEYFGNTILGTGPFNENSNWYWASAGKALTATLIGIAQHEGYLDIESPASNYLGEGWTSLTTEKEQLIKVKNQLTMTTGLEYNVPDIHCTLPSCLDYKVDPGQQWFYHNAPYTLLEKVVENATSKELNEYTSQKLETSIGMNGQWVKQGFNNVYWSNARDMARFGLLILNKGKWNDIEVLPDSDYYDQMVNPSQDLNPSYGYLWWLNGEESIVFPGLPNSFNTSLSDHAPVDLFAGMGKNGQFVDIVPSENLVVVRMGETPDDSLVPITFHDEMWEKINSLLN